MRARIPVLLVPLVLAAGACSRTTVMAPGGDPAQQGLVVEGVGRVNARPDTLVFTVTVSSEEDSATAALEQASARGRAVIKAVKEHGVADRDIQTTSLSLHPEHDDRGEIVGFRATEGFRIRVRDLEQAGPAVGATVAAAGDDARISGMSLEVADPEALQQTARTRAVKDALARGGELAESAGIELGTPLSISEGRAEGGRAFRLPFAADFETGVAGAAALAPRIETGTQEIVVRVSVRFEILR